MIQSSIGCQYHPDRIAVSKCEECQKALCVECKMVYQRKLMSINGKVEIRQVFCPSCYYGISKNHIKQGDVKTKVVNKQNWKAKKKKLINLSSSIKSNKRELIINYCPFCGNTMIPNESLCTKCGVDIIIQI